MQKKLQYESGGRYGRLMLTGKAFNDIKSFKYVEVICKCGVIKFVRFDHLKNGGINSCGCLRREMGSSLVTHGLTKHPLFRVWDSMKTRCYSKTAINFKDYGGSGVIVCEQWKGNFKSFYDWAIGKWQPGLQIDKDILYSIKFNQPTGKIYSPEFCCFVTPKVNMQHQKRTKLIEYNGQKKTLSEWCTITGHTFQRVYKRVHYAGWDIKEALETLSLTPNHYTKTIKQ